MSGRSRPTGQLPRPGTQRHAQPDLARPRSLRVQTTGPGEILGWSSLIYPYRWPFSGVAVLETRAIALDVECLRNKCERDPAFGYDMLQRLAQVMESRLEATRLQLIDMYGDATAGAQR